MSASIYEINDWAVSTVYSLHDIVKYQDVFYYARQRHTSSSSFDSSKWGGTTTFNGVTKPHFIWIASFDSTPNFEPKVKLIQFGEGYQQRLPDGINNNLLKLNLTFPGRTLDETSAIMHFLYARKGAESFVFTAFPPFGKAKLYKCPRFSAPIAFYNKYNISAEFEEVPS